MLIAFEAWSAGSPARVNTTVRLARVLPRTTKLCFTLGSLPRGNIIGIEPVGVADVEPTAADYRMRPEQPIAALWHLKPANAGVLLRRAG
jgi:hypothetical protein